MKECEKCGTEYEGNACPNGCDGSAPVQKPKKSKTKIIVIVAVAVVACAIIGLVFGETESDPVNTGVNTTVAGETTQENEENTTEITTTAKPTTTQNPEKIRSDYIDSCETISFKDLSRNPDKYKGEKFTFTGEVIQVQEPTFGDTVELRMNVTKTTYDYIDTVTYSDTIYATVEIPDGADRILEGDIITIYGECDGLYSYTSVLNAKISLPKIDIAYYSIDE